MKKRNLALAAYAAVIYSSLLFFACDSFSDIAIPETVSVKTSGTYIGALGKKHFDFSDKFGDDFISNLEGKAGGDVYKYIPDESDRTMKYLLHKNVYNVPLDVSSYISDIGIDDEISKSMVFEKDFSLPKIETSSSVDVLPGATGPFPFDIFVNVTMDPSLKSGTIGSGSIIIKAEGDGATLNFSSFTLSGITKGDGSPYGAGDFVDESTSGFLVNKKLNLKDGKFVMPLTQVRAEGQLVVASGSISAPSLLQSSLVVETLASGVADLSDVGGFVMNDTTENKKQVPSEMVAYVGLMKFGQASGNYYYKSDASGNITENKGQGKGLQFSAKNSFPSGNDIALEIVSETFGIDSTDGSIYEDGEPAASAKINAKGNETEFTKSFAEFGDVNVADTSVFGTKDNPAYIKFSVKLSNAQTFTNLTFGQTYKIAVKDSKMLFDWDMASIKLSNADPVDGEQDMSYFSMKSIMDDMDGELSKLVDNCDFESVPAYFLVRKPEGALAGDIGNISLSGKVYLGYTDASSTPVKDYIAGSESAAVTMPAIPPVAWPKAGETFKTPFEEKGKDYSFACDVANTLNKRPNDLKVNYSMGIAGGSDCNFYKARFDSLGPNDTTSIAIEMAAILIFKFNITKDTDLDVYEVADMDMSDMTDLMYRDNVLDTEKYAKYAGAISTMQLNYNFVNKAVEGLDAVVKVDDTHEGEPNAAAYSGFLRTVNLTKASDGNITFTTDEIKAALTHLFLPKMTMTVHSGPVTVNRDAIESESALSISPIVMVQLNDSVAIDIKEIIK